MINRRRVGLGTTAGLVRGVLAERVILSSTLDPFMPLRAVAQYAGVSVRKLRDFLDDPRHPLPHYRVGGKLLIRRSEFDAWIAAYRRCGRADIDRALDDALAELAPRGRR